MCITICRIFTTCYEDEPVLCANCPYLPPLAVPAEEEGEHYWAQPAVGRATPQWAITLLVAMVVVASLLMLSSCASGSTTQPNGLRGQFNPPPDGLRSTFSQPPHEAGLKGRFVPREP